MGMTSFLTDIRPLFRPVDVDHMKWQGLDLSSYDDVKWIDEGFPP
jgi:hypothetical protein